MQQILYEKQNQKKKKKKRERNELLVTLLPTIVVSADNLDSEEKS